MLKKIKLSDKSVIKLLSLASFLKFIVIVFISLFIFLINTKPVVSAINRACEKYSHEPVEFISAYVSLEMNILFIAYLFASYIIVQLAVCIGGGLLFPKLARRYCLHYEKLLKSDFKCPGIPDEQL